MELVQGRPPLPTASQGVFSRKEDFDMRLGKVLVYVLDSKPFMIAMHKNGIAFRGEVPVLKKAGVESFKKMLDRAIVHHEFLKKTWDEGGSQRFLSELEVDTILNPVVLAEP